MARKRESAHSGQFADSAAYSTLSSDAKALLEALQARADAAGGNKHDPILVEAEPGRFVKIRLSDKWRKLGAASPGNIEHARRIVDLAEAAFEAERAMKQ